MTGGTQVGEREGRGPAEPTGDSPTIGELYQGFVESGGRVLVCPHCAAAAGLEVGSLREGAKIGTSEDIVETLAGASKILDY